MTASVIPIFGKAATLNKILGVLEAALINRDEITTLDLISDLVGRHDLGETQVDIINKTLGAIAAWGNPHITMSAAGKVIKSAKQGSPLSVTGLAYYLDSTALLNATRPMTAIAGYSYALPYALGTAYEERIYEGLTNLCRNPHPAHYSIILQGLLEMDRESAEAGGNDDQLKLSSYILRLSDLIAPFDPQDALDGYSTILDNMDEDNPLFTETAEKLLETCRQVSLYDEDGAQTGLEQIIGITEGGSSIHQAAASLKKTIDDRLTSGNYDSTPPTVPADFLTKKGLQPG